MPPFHAMIQRISDSDWRTAIEHFSFMFIRSSDQNLLRHLCHCQNVHRFRIEIRHSLFNLHLTACGIRYKICMHAPALLLMYPTVAFQGRKKERKKNQSDVLRNEVLSSAPSISVDSGWISKAKIGSLMMHESGRIARSRRRRVQIME